MQRSISTSVKSALKTNNAANAPFLSQDQKKSVRDRQPRTSWIAPPSTYPDLKGYLRKRATNKRWQKRYFEANDHYLTYYKHKNSERLLACIDLRQVTKIDTGNTTADADVGEFYIELAGRIYVMKAGSEAEMTEWVSGLRLRAQDETERVKEYEFANNASASAIEADNGETAEFDNGLTCLDIVEEGDTRSLSNTDSTSSATATPNKSIQFAESKTTDVSASVDDFQVAKREEGEEKERSQQESQRTSQLRAVAEIPVPLSVKNPPKQAESEASFGARMERLQIEGCEEDGDKEFGESGQTLSASMCGGCFAWLCRRRVT